MSVYQFNLPDVGEGLSEGEIVRWLVAIGESVTADQLLVEVQTDKAIVEIPSPVAGVLTDQGGQPNDVVPVGAMLARIEMSGEASESVAAPSEEQTYSGTVAPVIDANSTQVTSPGGATAPSPSSGRAKASPATRKLARTLGVELAGVSPSGGRGQVTSDDVRAAAEGANSQSPTPQAPAAAAVAPALRPAAPSVARPSRAPPSVAAPIGEDRVEPLRGLRKQIALTMDHAWRTVPHIFSMDDMDATGLVNARRMLNEELAGEGTKLSFMPFFIRACALALRAHPRFNASIDMNEGTVTYHAAINIGLATQTDDGLIVTVIHGADQLGLVDLAKQVDELAELARTRRVTVAHLSNATFSISNYGSYGGHMGTPIVRPPECAIAGFGRVRDTVIPEDGQVVIRPVLPFCVSADHRLNDGADLGAFAATMSRYLAQPIKMLAAG
jgi:pyruvate dehydrogenase E2 component (dihydrolipoamide acetyltransferase)